MTEKIVGIDYIAVRLKLQEFQASDLNYLFANSRACCPVVCSAREFRNPLSREGLMKLCLHFRPDSRIHNCSIHRRNLEYIIGHRVPGMSDNLGGGIYRYLVC